MYRVNLFITALVIENREIVPPAYFNKTKSWHELQKGKRSKKQRRSL
jgi:hypothetical protein